MKIVIEYGVQHTPQAQELKKNIRSVVTIEDPLFENVTGLWCVPVENNNFKVTVGDAILFEGSAPSPYPTVQQIVDYIIENRD